MTVRRGPDGTETPCYVAVMFVVDLLCKEGHGFEGWFERSEDVRSQMDEGMLECPVCGGRDVQRRLGFRGIGGRRPADSAPLVPSGMADLPQRADPESASAAPMPLAVQRALSAVLRAVRTHGEDVGDRFAAVARGIHAGEEEERLVYGSASPEEARALVEDGVPFAALPIPEIDQN